MKNILSASIMCISILFFYGFTQDSVSKELPFEVHKIYAPVSITKTQLKAGNTLLDLNQKYKASWVKTYLSVEIATINNGKKRLALSKNDQLTMEQKENMYTADSGTEIAVTVHYMPENNLKHNDPKEMYFTIFVEPETDAKYPGGSLQLQKYLQEKVIGKIPSGTFVDYDMTAVKFTVDKEGHIADVHIFWEFKDEKIEKLLVEAICAMPNWEPASYDTGKKINQQLVLIVGNMENCAINLLNIRD